MMADNITPLRPDVGPPDFNRWWRAGFTEIIPVIPPGAPLSPATKVKPESRGKSPGFKGRYGWRSFDWVHHQTTEDDVARWRRDGANIGLRAARFPGLDIDVTDEGLADLLADLADKHLGEAPARTGRAPKRLMVYRLADDQAPLTRRRLWFKDPAGDAQLIELLGAGQQYVVDGRHPGTGAAYTWDRHPAQNGPDALPAITAAAIDAFFDEAVDILEMLGCGRFSPEGTGAEARDRASIDQDGLRAPSLEAVRAALDILPNPAETTRHDYMTIGYAVRAALPDDPEDAYALWEAWALKWPVGDVPETIRADWERMPAPYAVGWGYLRDKAAPHGLAAMEAEGEFDPDEGGAEAAVDEALRARQEAREGARLARRDRLHVLRFADITPATDTTTFVDDLLGYGTMSVLYGESNVGKTFFATDLALHVAWGRPWRGREVDPGGVIYCALEGAYGLRNRIEAFRRHHGLEGQALPFGMVPVSLNLLDPNADTGPLIDLIREEAEDLGVPMRLVVIDTLARAMAGGNENSSEDMGALVASMDRIREATGAHVLIVHHSGKDRAQGARGHSSLRASIDTEIEIIREDGAAAAVATVKKQRDLEGGETLPFRLDVVEVGETPRGKVVTSCVVVEAAPADGKSTAGGGEQRLTGRQRVALQALADLVEAEGRPAPDGEIAPDGVAVVETLRWKRRVHEAGIPASDDPNSKRRVFNAIKRELIECGLIGASPSGRFVWTINGGGTNGTKRDTSRLSRGAALNKTPGTNGTERDMSRPSRSENATQEASAIADFASPACGTNGTERDKTGHVPPGKSGSGRDSRRGDKGGFSPLVPPCPDPPMPHPDPASRKPNPDWPRIDPDTPAGTVRIYRGQRYVLTGFWDHLRQDGTLIVLAEWNTHCAKCGAETVVTTPLVSDWPTRRCKACKRPGSPVARGRGKSRRRKGASS